MMARHKKIMRAHLLARRKAVLAKLRRQKSRKIFNKLCEIPRFLKARKIAFYYHIIPEVETRSFLGQLIRDKEVFLPRVDRKRKMLTLHRVRAFKADLCRGAYGIMEPKPRCEKATASAMDMIVVPGVGFDRKGNRIGRGAGYYDRLLRCSGKAWKVGVCFREQIVRKVPVMASDVAVDRVITD